MNPDSRVAIFDPEAFYPFRSLVHGSLVDVAELEAIEGFLRAIVLHDEMIMECAPFSYDEIEHEWTQEEIDAGGRTVIVSVGPTLDEYGLFSTPAGPRSVPQVELSPLMTTVAEAHSNAGVGNVYYEAHIDLLKRLVGNVQAGGSIVCRSSFVQDAVQAATAYPADLFKNLDNDWQLLAKKMDSSNFGPLIPPVLGIVLTRSASRDKIPNIIRDLRDEWSDARRKVWDLSDALRTARTVSQANEINRELEQAGRYFSPLASDNSSRPAQILWELVIGGIGGSIIASVSGVNPIVGAATGMAAQAMRTTQKDADLGKILLKRGAFDLARRVRTAAREVEFDSLKRFLRPDELKSLTSGQL